MFNMKGGSGMATMLKSMGIDVEALTKQFEETLKQVVTHLQSIDHQLQVIAKDQQMIIKDQADIKFRLSQFEVAEESIGASSNSIPV